MEYRVQTPNGLLVTCSTPEEVWRLEQMFGKGERSTSHRNAGQIRSFAPIVGDWKPGNEVFEFHRRLSKTQRTLIEAIANSPGEIGIDELRSITNKANNRDVSVLINTCKHIAKDCGIEWSQIVESRLKGARTTRTAVYKPGPLLRNEKPEEVKPG